MVSVLPERLVGPRMCNHSLTAHMNHAAVQQSTKGTQLRVDTTTVSLAVPVDVFPLPLAK
jgi:hypothetical protein